MTIGIRFPSRASNATRKDKDPQRERGLFMEALPPQATGTHHLQTHFFRKP